MPTGTTTTTTQTQPASSETSKQSWRSTDATDMQELWSATESYYSPDDFSGRAALYESIFSASPIQVDLLVQDVQFTIEDRMQIEEHLSSSFGTSCLGKSPMLAHISCILVEAQKNYGKRYLMDAWRTKLRVEACARTGQWPVLQFVNSVLCGPFTSMRITDSATSEDTLDVNMTMLVFTLQMQNKSSLVTLDYKTGYDSPGIVIPKKKPTETEGDGEVTKQGR